MKEPNPQLAFSPHRQRKFDGMVQTILDTARQIMREQGVAALSMQELARRMNMRAPSLYHYFNSKMEIYDALFQLGFRLYAAHMEKAAAGNLSWQAYIALSFESYLSFAKQNPELYQLCFERPVPGFVPSDESLQISLQLLNQSYQRADIYKGMMHSELSAQQTVDLLIAMMHGITAMHLANEPEVPIGEGRFASLIPAAMALLEKAWS
jgi:AcrR family transcriptional regulator